MTREPLTVEDIIADLGMMIPRRSLNGYRTITRVVLSATGLALHHDSGDRRMIEGQPLLIDPLPSLHLLRVLSERGYLPPVMPHGVAHDWDGDTFARVQ